MNENTAISVENLSKTFQIRKNSNTLRNYLVHAFQRKESQTKEALKEVSFTIQKGECVGIIGSNGAGKSTLLKIMAKILWPNEGIIQINGRLSAMLEVGTGFYPDLTGRENIYMSGALLGMTRSEIKLHLDDIIEFSGVKNYIDTPVRYYSSGMYVRLGFSVSSFLRQDIVIIDEVLAVGDNSFKQQCIARMNEISSKKDKTILMVSHDLPLIRSLCKRSLFFENGQLKHDGDTQESISLYIDKPLLHSNSLVSNEYLSISKTSINGSGVNSGFVKAGESFSISFELELKKKVSELVIRLQVRDRLQPIGVLNNILLQKNQFNTVGNLSVECVALDVPLNNGRYSIDLEIADTKRTLLDQKNSFEIEVQPSAFFESGILPGKSRGLTLFKQKWNIVR